mmetsp:Transcript_21804/g.36751  ORF Transcript_21804/g.36751 Transcript_21804/m.36751 type:complete len:241 (-) Transcript_21804:182-904(-)
MLITAPFYCSITHIAVHMFKQRTMRGYRDRFNMKVMVLYRSLISKCMVYGQCHSFRQLFYIFRHRQFKRIHRDIRQLQLLLFSLFPKSKGIIISHIFSFFQEFKIFLGFQSQFQLFLTLIFLQCSDEYSSQVLGNVILLGDALSLCQKSKLPFISSFLIIYFIRKLFHFRYATTKHDSLRTRRQCLAGHRRGGKSNVSDIAFFSGSELLKGGASIDRQASNRQLICPPHISPLAVVFVIS